MHDPAMLRYWWRREMRPRVILLRFALFLACAACLTVAGIGTITPFALTGPFAAHFAYYTPWIVAPVAAWFALLKLRVLAGTDNILVTPVTTRKLYHWTFLPFCCSLLVAYEGSLIVFRTVIRAQILAVATQLGTEPYYFAFHHNLQAALSIFFLPSILFALILITGSVSAVIGLEAVMMACLYDAFGPRWFVDFYVMNRLILIAGVCSVFWVLPRYRELLSPEVGVTRRKRAVRIACAAGLLFALVAAKVLASIKLENDRTCRDTLWSIDGDKRLYAEKIKLSPGAAITMANLVPPGLPPPERQTPRCPCGGTYTVNVLGVDPTCSIPGHTLTRIDEMDRAAEQSADESTHESTYMEVGPDLIIESFEVTEPKLRRIWRLFWKLG